MFCGSTLGIQPIVWSMSFTLNRCILSVKHALDPQPFQNFHPDRPKFFNIRMENALVGLGDWAFERYRWID